MAALTLAERIAAALADGDTSSQERVQTHNSETLKANSGSGK